MILGNRGFFVDVMELDDLCPHCGFTSVDHRRICTRCGAEAPIVSKGVWRDGLSLVALKSATLPYRCLLTNEPAESLRHKNFSWRPQWIVFVLLLSPLIFLIVALLVTQKATLDLPYCSRVRQRVHKATLATWFCVVLGLGVIISTFFTIQAFSFDVGLIVFLTGAFILVFGGLICSSLANPIAPALITKTHIWLKGVHPDYLATLPRWYDEDAL